MESLRIFWVWWRDHLLEWLPGHTERRDTRAADGLILSDPELVGIDPVVFVTERRQGAEAPRGRLPLDPANVAGLREEAARFRLPTVLRLPASLLLEREVILPLAAERDLARVLFYEMDRFTPFAATEVLWTAVPLTRDRAQGKLTALLSLVPLASVAPWLDALRQAGVKLAGLELAAADGERRRIPLDHAADAASQDRWLRPALLAIAALFAFAILLPFLMQGAANAALDRRIATAAPMVARVRALRAQLAAGSTGSEVIAAERKRAGDALEAICLLTTAFPDETYLTSLTYDAGNVTMDGQSKSAAALIAPLTTDPRIADASFTAPVVRNTLGLDSFSMRLRITR